MVLVSVGTMQRGTAQHVNLELRWLEIMITPRLPHLETELRMYTNTKKTNTSSTWTACSGRTISRVKYLSD